MSKELKPCPCCGGKAELRHRPFDEDFFIKCEYQNWKCNTQTLYYGTEEEAIEAWNNRPSPWHTGMPTEEGWYIVHVKSDLIDKPFDVIRFKEGKWWDYLEDVLEVVSNDYILAWQKIESYEEKSE